MHACIYSKTAETWQLSSSRCKIASSCFWDPLCSNDLCNLDNAEQVTKRN